MPSGNRGIFQVARRSVGPWAPIPWSCLQLCLLPTPPPESTFAPGLPNYFNFLPMSFFIFSPLGSALVSYLPYKKKPKVHKALSSSSCWENQCPLIFRRGLCCILLKWIHKQHVTWLNSDYECACSSFSHQKQLSVEVGWDTELSVPSQDQVKSFNSKIWQTGQALSLDSNYIVWKPVFPFSFWWKLRACTAD